MRVTKRQRLDEPPPSIYLPTTTADQTRDRPIHDPIRDQAFRDRMLAELEQKTARTNPSFSSTQRERTHGEGPNALIYDILQKACQPNKDTSNEIPEVYFLAGDEAASRVESATPDAPIFTQDQQQFRWTGRDRPIVELFRRIEDMDRSVSVQIPSRKSTLRSFEKRKLDQVRKRFLDNQHTGDPDDPWNLLDLRNPLPPSTLPSFLTGENCQLLYRIRDAILMEDSAERPVATREEWNEWRDVLDCVLLSEGGHITPPYVDRKSTWITAQELCIGFG
jgi:hypothetical protein